MCGINGFISSSKKTIQDIKRMNDAILHRGPDDDGVYLIMNKYLR